MVKNSLDKIIQKKRLKEINGFDTLNEELKILDAFTLMYEECGHEEDDSLSEELTNLLSEHPTHSSIPYVICMEHISLYLELFQNVKDQAKQIEEAKCITPEFFQAFDLFDEFFCLYYSINLIRYADWVEEEKLSICIDDLPFYDDSMDKFEYIHNMITILEQINKKLTFIMESHNKGQCMSFCPLVVDILEKISLVMSLC